jgi:hypothetical protein
VAVAVAEVLEVEEEAVLVSPHKCRERDQERDRNRDHNRDHNRHRGRHRGLFLRFWIRLVMMIDPKNACLAILS